MLVKVKTVKNVWCVTKSLRFKFQDAVLNGCHDLTMLSVNISDIVILY